MPCVTVADAGGFEIEVVHVRPPADGDEEMRCLGSSRSPLAWRARPAPRANDAAHLRDLDAAAQPDALALERVEHDGRAFADLRRRAAVSASSTVTSEPSRRNACASSRPTAPAPMTMRWRGRSPISDSVSVVKCVVSARPEIAGSTGEEPVAMTKRRALMVDVVDRNGACIGEARRAFEDAHAKSDETFARSVRRERGDDIAHVVAITVGKSTLVRPDLTPKRAPLRTACARSAAAIRRLRRHARRNF